MSGAQTKGNKMNSSKMTQGKVSKMVREMTEQQAALVGLNMNYKLANMTEKEALALWAAIKNKSLTCSVADAVEMAAAAAIDGTRV
jgi:hypothetical protein